MADSVQFTLYAGEITANKTYVNKKSGFRVSYIKSADMKKAFPAGGYYVVGQIGVGRTETGVLSFGGVDEKVYKTRKMPHTSVSGYVQVGEHEFIAVVRDILAAIILAVIAGLLVIAAIAAAVVLFWPDSSDTPPADNTGSGVIDTGAELGEGEVSVPEKTETKGKQIKINGIAQMQLKAGQTSQNYVFANPEENPCYFQIEIEMRGTGEILYKSDLIPPGYHISKFELNRALDAGEYDVTVHFLCFSFDKEQRPLNNMDIKTVIVAS